MRRNFRNFAPTIRFLNKFMSRRTFRFKQFAMTDVHCGMRINTDGVLLGAWASVAPEALRSVLDVGSGCGVIALMLAQRAQVARVVAVECDPGAAADACANFASSPWPERIRLVDKGFEHYKPESDERFDLMVSNPPFFIESLKSPDATRAAARHEGTLSFEVLAGRAGSILAPTGRLAVIMPSDADARTLATAATCRIYPRRHCLVRTRPDMAPVRSLWEFSLEDGSCEETSLCIRDDNGDFSTQYKSFTHDFHIFM